MAKKKKELTLFGMLPLFVVSVSLAFSIVFTVLLFPVVTAVQKIDITLLFIALLIVTATVASTVTLLFFLILSKKL